LEEIEVPLSKIVNGILIKAIKLGPAISTLSLREDLPGPVPDRRQDDAGHVASHPDQERVVSRLKIMASLDIAERRLPGRKDQAKAGKVQRDGFPCFDHPYPRWREGRPPSARQVIPQLDLSKLGFEESSFEDVKKAVHKPVGMILVTGPTGAEKPRPSIRSSPN